MIDLETRLSELGELLALDGDVVAPVVAAIGDDPVSRPRSAVMLRVAAIAMVVFLAAALLVPSARDTVSGWIGLDRVRVERRDDLVVPTSAPSAAATDVVLQEQVLVVDGTTVTLGTIDGSLSDVFIAKSVGAGTEVLSIDIDGMPALWIAEPHEVIVERDGQPVSERVAGATLLWQDGDVLWRVEGFADQARAVEFARSR